MKRTTRSIAIGLTVAISLVLAPASALAVPEGAGCEGLYRVARFMTDRNGDTPGHQRVHALYEPRHCGPHH